MYMKNHKHTSTYNYTYRFIQRKGQYFWRWEYRSMWEKFRKNIYLILNDYRGRVIWISSSKSLRLFCGFWWRLNFKKKGGYTWLIARSHLEVATREKKKNIKINSDEKRAIFTHQLPTAPRLTMGFPNICCIYFNKLIVSV